VSNGAGFAHFESLLAEFDGRKFLLLILQLMLSNAGKIGAS
jgi:hypothetical protein